MASGRHAGVTGVPDQQMRFITPTQGRPRGYPHWEFYPHPALATEMLLRATTVAHVGTGPSRGQVRWDPPLPPASAASARPADLPANVHVVRGQACPQCVVHEVKLSLRCRRSEWVASHHLGAASPGARNDGSIAAMSSQPSSLKAEQGGNGAPLATVCLGISVCTIRPAEPRTHGGTPARLFDCESTRMRHLGVGGGGKGGRCVHQHP